MTNRFATGQYIAARPPGIHLRTLPYSRLEPVHSLRNERGRFGGQAEAIRPWRRPAIVTLAVMAAVTALTTVAPPEAAANQARRARAVEATAPRDAGEPIMEIVSLKSQKVTVYDADGWVLRAPVSSGMSGRETPAGVFSVVEKDKDHHSNLYDDARMPNMQRIT
jgi:hypothetical protein